MKAHRKVSVKRYRVRCGCVRYSGELLVIWRRCAKHKRKPEIQRAR